MSKVIKFYDVKDEYGCFSNYSPHSIELYNKTWQTAEHCFHAQKFAGTPYEETVRQAYIPAFAAALGKDPSYPLRKDWESVKLYTMRDILYAKFTQHEDLMKILLDTEDATLIADTIHDNFWGNGGDDSGKNWLGVLLMETRERIRKSQQK